MNKVYYLSVYRFEHNHYQRFIVSAESEDDAVFIVNNYLEKVALAKNARFICLSPHTVFEEL